METLGAFFKDWDFWINFVANLVGALVGVTLAFGIERWRASRAADNLYGRVLSACRYELAYADPDNPLLPATRSLLLNPVMQERAPHSLIHLLMVISGTIDKPEDKSPNPKDDTPEFDKLLAREGEKRRIAKLIALAIERVDRELRRLSLERPPDPEADAVRLRMRGITEEFNRERLDLERYTQERHDQAREDRRPS